MLLVSRTLRRAVHEKGGGGPEVSLNEVVKGLTRFEAAKSFSHVLGT